MPHLHPHRLCRFSMDASLRWHDAEGASTRRLGCARPLLGPMGTEEVDRTAA
jgi:hypothetical protein